MNEVPEQIVVDTFPGGSVIHVYDTADGALLHEHLGRSLPKLFGSAAFERALDATLADGHEAAIVAYDGTTGERGAFAIPKAVGWTGWAVVRLDIRAAPVEPR